MIPLDPGRGGRSIGLAALECGDIIVSTTSAWISGAIRWATGSEVSHAILYIGAGEVVEAVSEGVVKRTLLLAVHDAALAVSYRKPDLTATQRTRVREFATVQLGRGYDHAGILGQAGLQLDRKVLCEADVLCIRRVSRMNMRIQQQDKFFCSELIMAAFAFAGVPLSNESASWSSPDDIAKMQLHKVLNYVGHLKA